jgi:ribonuclease HI/8-oxo-dGTP pyrophosphatase MutT (NUDIX family)
MRDYIPPNSILIPKNAKRVFTGVIYDVYQWKQRLFDGNYTTFEMLKRPDTIQVLAIKDNKAIVVNEEQPGIKPYLGLPGGRHDKVTENELQAAKRELLEETGLSFKQWKLLSATQPHSKMDWFIYTFLAYDFDRQTKSTLDPGERIQVKSLSLNELKQLQQKDKTIHIPKEIFDNINSFDELIKDKPHKMNIEYEILKLYTDGGSRGNPGPSACAYVIYDDKDVLVEKRGFYLGFDTNNQAEYEGLIRGLERITEFTAVEVLVYMDSELVVKQLNGQYRVKNEGLRSQFNKVKDLELRFDKVTINYIPRRLNHEADREVNRILDENS